MQRPKLLGVILLVPLIVSLTACGSSGGGGGDGPAKTSVKAFPDAIDSGDSTDVITRLQEFTKGRLAIKFRFPNSLSYIRGSSLVIAGDLTDDSSPFVRASDDENTYIVFLVDLKQANFVDQQEIEVYFSLVGSEDDPDGEIAVDVDENIGDETYNFDIANPKFTAQDDTDIRVGPAPSPTPSQVQN